MTECLQMISFMKGGFTFSVVLSISVIRVCRLFICILTVQLVSTRMLKVDG